MKNILETRQSLKRSTQFLLFLALVIVSCTKTKTDFSIRNQDFDSGWKFNKGDVSGAQMESFDDSHWHSLDLPHDWSIEDLPIASGKKQIGPFSEESAGKRATGHVTGGIGWYRKSFTLGKSAEGKKVQILFDGVYMNSEVWINSHLLGFHPYGYTPFYYDLTPYVKPAGENNTIVVKVCNNGQNSRWYSGSGIYRHVVLQVTDKINIPIWGISVSTFIVNKTKSIATFKINIANESKKSGDLKISTRIISPEGQTICNEQTSKFSHRDSKTAIEQSLVISNPILWSVDSPAIYSAVTKVSFDGVVVDQQTTTFGIRTIEFSSQKGFLLNGEKVLLKGGCMHHDNGPLGAAAIDRAEERRVELMKKYGFNAIRTSHNPPSQKFLEACDRLGILVIDEAFDQWQLAKNPQDYHLYFNEWYQRDLESMVLRDQNHPSVIIWSIGNEIYERADSSGLLISQKLNKIIKNIDPTRPVTQAICDSRNNKGIGWEATIPSFALLDIGGYNYQWRRYESDHNQFSDRMMIGTESIPKEVFENWKMVEKYPFVLGDFVWTSMDYFGESGIGCSAILDIKAKELPVPDWPWYNSFCGDIDICGFKKPQSYYRDVVWKISNLEMAVHSPIPSGMKELVSYWGWPDEKQSWNWTGSEGKKLQVNVYCNYPEIRLELNGKVVGSKSVSQDTKLIAMFEVPYEAGELKAIALKDGKEVEIKILKTTGKPAKIRMSADRMVLMASRNDLSYVTVEVVDKDGELIPNANLPIKFNVEGVGELAAVENGNPLDIKSFRMPYVSSFNGRCLVIVRPTGTSGEIKLKAESNGLGDSEVIITSK